MRCGKRNQLDASVRVEQYSGGAWTNVASSSTIDYFAVSKVTATNPTASGGDAVAIGGQAAATADSTVAIGFLCEANIFSSFALGRLARATRDSELAMSMASFVGGGDAKTSHFWLTASTTDATQTEMLTQNLTRITLPNNSSAMFKINLVARRTDADGENDAWEFTGLIHRDANAASTTLDALQQNQIGATAWSVAVDADTSNGSLRLRVTGSNSVRWLADVSLTQLTE
jgi:hypothetical protein